MKIAICLVALVLLIGCSKRTRGFDAIEEYIEENIDMSAFDEEPKEVEEITGHVQESFVLPEPINETVYFDLNSDELTLETIEILNSLHTSIEGGFSLSITGGCCPIGEDIYNYRLGLRRAHSVYLYLDAMFNKKVKMECVSYGEDNLVNNNPDEYYLNRRVIITGLNRGSECFQQK